MLQFGKQNAYIQVYLNELIALKMAFLFFVLWREAEIQTAAAIQMEAEKLVLDIEHNVKSVAKGHNYTTDPVHAAMSTQKLHQYPNRERISIIANCFSFL